MAITTEHVTNKGQGTTRIPNKLGGEKSPYLLQHQYNPVYWYPWSDEAFEKARKENKPIFLSIGYSTCHWCHVMAHECFEDEEVAQILNDHFISIKVDKEERPDIDTVYMTVCQATTGHGGWPLTILMTPDQKPFYAATYIPKHTRYGMIGLMDLLTQVHNDWETNSKDMLQTGDKIAKVMKESFEGKSNKGTVSKDLVNVAVSELKQSFDHDYGGFGNEPKFPTPHNLMFLLAYASLEADEQSLFMVENTLKHMYRGGIYDHIGYGFSRYSTDARWLVPHFEKMLYDNALLTITYLEAYQYTKNPLYKTIAEQILDYIRREMTDKEGGFYCAQDADSEGVEGKYYVFKPEEITAVLQNDDAGFFCNYFDITKEGNWEGASIPNRIKANELNPENERVVRLSKYIYNYRLDRSALHKDDKILTSWNALMITAYAKAAVILRGTEYADIAEKAVEFINTKLMDETGRLYVRYREENAAFYGHLDDYSFYIMALLQVYDATFHVDYLKQAIKLTDQMLELFWDDINEGFFLNASDAEQLIYRPKEVYDGAIPSGNSVAGFVLQRLAHITANPKYREYADKQLSFLAGQVKDYPAGHCFSQKAFLEALYPSKEIVCVIGEAEENENTAKTKKKEAFVTGEYDKLRKYMAENYEPNTVVLVKTEKNQEELQKIADYVKDYHIINDRTTYYVCENHSCQAPVNDLVTNTQNK
ncbi:thioredoxin domain-containing protein [Mobilitalea sibirica]|uniref:Thioredoxin domain-containing protein n=1 Tax=Mobilitalea sibirica TaxID=1462919 RepID=A0A8J7HDT4_9FIRM|nr:thioredoxin domain-containing protein [Mobilitalea sibirica]MBH1941149.1 thioredoxin domain-containing protein [Mobilitalea sibirica]